MLHERGGETLGFFDKDVSTGKGKPHAWVIINDKEVASILGIPVQPAIDLIGSARFRGSLGKDRCISDNSFQRTPESIALEGGRNPLGNILPPRTGNHYLCAGSFQNLLECHDSRRTEALAASGKRARPGVKPRTSYQCRLEQAARVAPSQTLPSPPGGWWGNRFQVDFK